MDSNFNWHHLLNSTCRFYGSEDVAENFGLLSRVTGIVGIRNNIRKFVASQVPLNPEQTILDAGCGNGLLSLILHQQNKFHRLISVDRSAPMLRVASQRLSGSKGKHLHFVQSDLTDMPFRSQSVDIVVCLDVLHHLPSDESHLQAVLDLTHIARQRVIFEMKSWDFFTPLRNLAHKFLIKHLWPVANQDFETGVIWRRIATDQVAKTLKSHPRVTRVQLKRCDWRVEWYTIIADLKE